MTAHEASLPVRAPSRRWAPSLVVGAALFLAAASAPLAMKPPAMIAVTALALGVALVIALHPVSGAFLLLALTPLTSGLERGDFIPLLRPSEAILALVLGALAARGFFELLRGRSVRVRLNTFEWWLVAFAVAGSVLPLLWMFARGRDIAQDDLLYASYVWKYAAVYLVVRVTVRSMRDLRRCLAISLGTGAVVGTLAILHVLQVEWVHDFLTRWYGSEDVPNVPEFAFRGTSTVGSSFAVADVMVFNFAVATAWAFYERRLRPILFLLALLFVFGTVASGQFSAPMALAVAVLTVGLITQRLTRLLLLGLPIVVVAGIALAPVVLKRLEGFGSAAGVPPSWVGRWENLTTYFWPPLASDLNWLTGVRVAGRVPAPENWRDWVWIESGYTWLLWSGGVVFLVVGCVFLAVGIRATAKIARQRRDALGAAAMGALTGLWVNVVLMLIDVHLTLRGSGDLLFALLALSMSGIAASQVTGGARERLPG